MMILPFLFSFLQWTNPIGWLKSAAQPIDQSPTLESKAEASRTHCGQWHVKCNSLLLNVRDRNSELLNLDPQGKSVGHANLLPVLLGFFESPVGTRLFEQFVWFLPAEPVESFIMFRRRSFSERSRTQWWSASHSTETGIISRWLVADGGYPRSEAMMVILFVTAIVIRAGTYIYT